MTPTDPTIEADVLEEAKAAILADLRDRRLLKWLFTKDADTDPHAIGYVDGPIDCAVQNEIAGALARAAITAYLTTKPSQQSQPPAADEVEALRIAAFLRERATSRHSPTARAALNNAADAIERGDWRE